MNEQIISDKTPGQSTEWMWKYHSGEESVVLPENLTAQDMIRSFDGRQVYRKDGVYYKFYFKQHPAFFKSLRERFLPPAKEEFSQLLLLEKNQIAAVVPIAWGKRGTDSVLVTREAAGTCTVSEFLLDILDRGERIPESFLRSWAEFVKKILDNRFYFSDFHAGNLLYDTENKKFLVVDPLGIKQPLFLRRNRLLRMLKRQFQLIFEFGTKADLMLIFSIISPGEPQRLYDDLTAYCVYYVQHLQLPKRLKWFRRQKNIQDGIQRRLSPDLRWYSLENTVQKQLTPEKAQEVWERDYVCSLYRLPLLHTVGRIPETGLIYQQSPGPFPHDKAIAEELLERLFVYGLDPEEFEFCTDFSGRTVLVDRATI